MISELACKIMLITTRRCSTNFIKSFELDSWITKFQLEWIFSKKRINQFKFINKFDQLYVRNGYIW